MMSSRDMPEADRSQCFPQQGHPVAIGPAFHSEYTDALFEVAKRERIQHSVVSLETPNRSMAIQGILFWNSTKAMHTLKVYAYNGRTCITQGYRSCSHACCKICIRGYN